MLFTSGSQTWVHIRIPGGPVKTDCWAHLRISDSVALGWNPRICISSTVLSMPRCWSGDHILKTLAPNKELKVTASATNQALDKYSNTVRGCSHFQLRIWASSRLRTRLSSQRWKCEACVQDQLAECHSPFHTHRLPDRATQGALDRVKIGHLFKAMLSKYMLFILVEAGEIDFLLIELYIPGTYIFMLKNKMNPLHWMAPNILTSLAVSFILYYSVTHNWVVFGHSQSLRMT